MKMMSNLCIVSRLMGNVIPSERILRLAVRSVREESKIFWDIRATVSDGGNSSTWVCIGRFPTEATAHNRMIELTQKIWPGVKILET